MTSNSADPASTTLDRLGPAATQALQDAEQAIAVASRKGSGKDGKAAAKKILSAARQVLPILAPISELHPIAKLVVSTFSALVDMESTRQSNNLQIAAVYHSMTLMMHTLRYLGALLDQADGLSDDLQWVLKQMTQSMEDFGNFVNLYYRYSAKQAIFRILRSTEYKGQLLDINQSFVTHKENLRLILESRTMITTYDTHDRLRSVPANIETIITMLGAVTAKEHKAEEFSRNHGGPEAVIHDDALLSKVAEILGEKLPPHIRSALRKELQEILKNDRTQFKFALQATREQIEENVARSEQNIIRHLDSGPHELINDPDVRNIWQEMNWRTSVKVRPFVDALQEYFQRQFAIRKQDEGEAPHDSWTLKYLSKVMYHPAIGNAIDEDGSGFVSVHELNHFLECRPVPEWTVPETLVFWAVVWPKSNKIYYEDIMYDLGRIKGIVNHMKPVPDAFKEYLEVLGYLDVVVGSLGDGDTGEDGEGLSHLLQAYVDATDSKIRQFLVDTEYRIADTSTLDFIVGKSQRIELVVAPLLWLALNHQVEIFTEQGSRVDPDVLVHMCETSLTIFSSFAHRYSELQRGWKQQKLDVGLYTDSFANGVFAALSKAGENAGFVNDVDEYYVDEDYYYSDDEDAAANAPEDKTEQLLQLVMALTDKLSGMETSIETRLASMEQMLRGGQGSQKAKSGGGGKTLNAMGLGIGDHVDDDTTGNDDGAGGGKTLNVSGQEFGDHDDDDNGNDDGAGGGKTLDAMGLGDQYDGGDGNGYGHDQDASVGLAQHDFQFNMQYGDTGGDNNDGYDNNYDRY